MKRVSVPTEELIEILMLQIQSNGSGILPIVGTSMNPMLYEDRDDVIVAMQTRPLNVGDIILYKRENGQYVLHRIVKMTERTYICCGDNQWKPERVKPEQILAVVTGFTRKGKTYDITHKGYQRYVKLRIFFRPMRRPILAIRHAAQKWIRNIYKKAKASGK